MASFDVRADNGLAPAQPRCFSLELARAQVTAHVRVSMRDLARYDTEVEWKDLLGNPVRGACLPHRASAPSFSAELQRRASAPSLRSSAATPLSRMAAPPVPSLQAGVVHEHACLAVATCGGNGPALFAHTSSTCAASGVAVHRCVRRRRRGLHVLRRGLCERRARMGRQCHLPQGPAGRAALHDRGARRNSGLLVVATASLSEAA